MVFEIFPRLIETAYAHGGELGEENSSNGAKGEKSDPHGGQVVEFGDKHIEFTANHESGEIVIFFLDKNLKAIPVPESYSGVVYLNMANGSKKTVALKRGTEGPVLHLEADSTMMRKKD